MKSKPSFKNSNLKNPEPTNETQPESIFYAENYTGDQHRNTCNTKNNINLSRTNSFIEDKTPLHKPLYTSIPKYPQEFIPLGYNEGRSSFQPMVLERVFEIFWVVSF